MVQTILLVLGALLMLLALAGFVRSLWAPKPPAGTSASSANWTQTTDGTSHGHSGHDGGVC